MITVKDFWAMTDEAKLETEYASDEKLKFLQDATANEIRDICIQYRYFVSRFPDNLGVLISKLPFGKLKTLIADIISEELGSGDHIATHIGIYDSFLLSIGIKETILNNSVHPSNKVILDEIQYLNKSKSCSFSIGLCGMGGECLCQIYLTSMYKNLIKNKFIKEIFSSVDWKFWDLHVGEADILHRELVKQAITEIVENDPSLINDLAEGYIFAKTSWDKFWINNFEAVGNKNRPI
jgi:hypothetical protein